MAKRKRKYQLTNLKNKSVIVGVTGGVAAYKAVDLVRRLKEKGASVRVIMTGAAEQFITPLSLQLASETPVLRSLFQEPLSHIALTSESDVMVVAPATANIVAKFAHGIADDMLSTAFLSFQGPVIIAPSMNWKMYENPVFQSNLEKLLRLGVIQIGPESGALACGEQGKGRLAEVKDIVDAVISAVTAKDLTGKKFIVTAGPTREFIDPVRFISNRSSGRMGFSIANAACKRGADVVLISGPSSLDRPSGVRFISVNTAEEMLKAVQKETGKGTSVLVMAAAVADFRPKKYSDVKTDKKLIGSLSLVRTDDIIKTIAAGKKRPFIIGFAAETGNKIARAELKMKQKKMDMIVFNDVTEQGAGFETETNRVVIIDRHGTKQTEMMSKDAIADEIIDRYLEIKT